MVHLVVYVTATKMEEGVYGPSGRSGESSVGLVMISSNDEGRVVCLLL